MALRPTHLAFALLAALSASLLTMSEASASQLDAAFSLVGEHVTLRRGDPRVLTSHRVELSSIGLRARRTGTRSVAIMNFAERRFWFVDFAREMVHAVPLEFRPSDPSTAVDLRHRLHGGVFSAAPCVGLDATDPLPVRWRGREAVVWLCVDELGDVFSTQWFSPAFGVVVRSRLANGRMEEFRAIERIPFVDDRFRPPARLRTVDAADFRSIAEPLSTWTPEP